MKKLYLYLLFALSALLSPDYLGAAEKTPDSTSDEVGWPRSYTVENSEIVLDEPRVEKWQDSVITARFAVSIKTPDQAQPFLGSISARADTLSNVESRTVSIYNITVQDLQFPGAESRREEFSRLMDALVPEKPVKVSLDRVLASVPSEDIVTRDTVLTQTQNKAPRIIVSNAPSVLLAFDGAPVFRSISGSGLEAAVNTPATVLRPEGSKSPVYLLTNEGLWLTAQTVQGTWKQAAQPPAGLDRIPADHPVAQAIKSVTPPPGAVFNLPDVVMTDEPAEMIQIEGKPSYKQIGELPLVRVGNTDSPLFYHFDLSSFYVLISGRWFTASELKGPWVYVPNNALPKEFAQIPLDDPSASVRVSIAGTREAEEAVKEAQIPTVARVNIREAPTIEVDYDGEPIFEEIRGTELFYAVNTTYDVIRVGGYYYCCHDGLWFVADRPFGSRWRCATSLPRVIYTIPPSCPLYHTRFCYIDSFADDEVVYRYSSGYFGTYIDPVSRVCIYGTGYRYQPYISDRYYCGRSWTYGFGSNYRPRHGFIYENKHVAHTNWYYEDRRSDRHKDGTWRASSGSRGSRTVDGKWASKSPETTPYSRWTRGVKEQHDDVADHLVHKTHTKEKPHVISHGRADERTASVFKKDPKIIKDKPINRENRGEPQQEKPPITVKKIAPSDSGRRGAEPTADDKKPDHREAKKDIEISRPKPVHHEDSKPQIPTRQDPRPDKPSQPKEIKRERVVEPDHSRGKQQDRVEEPRSIEKKEIQPRARVVEEPRRVQHDPPREIKREQPKEQPRVQHDPPREIKREQPREQPRVQHDSPREIKREQPREQPRVQHDPPQPSRESKSSESRSESRSSSSDSKKDDKKDDKRGR